MLYSALLSLSLSFFPSSLLAPYLPLFLSLLSPCSLSPSLSFPPLSLLPISLSFFPSSLSLLPISLSFSLYHFSSLYFSKGPVKFDDDGTRIVTAFEIKQYQLDSNDCSNMTLCHVTIGAVDILNDSFRYIGANNETTVWPGKVRARYEDTAYSIPSNHQGQV